MKNIYYTVGGALLALLTGTASAGDTGPYLGIGVGTTQVSVDSEAAISVSEIFGSTVTGVSTDDSDDTLRILAGVNLNKHIGIEFNYADLGGGSVTVTDDVSTFTTDQYKASVDGFGFALVINPPITNKLSGLIKLGAFSWSSDITSSVDFGGGNIVTAKINETGADLMFGLGLIYRFNPSFAIRGEFERIAIDKEEALVGDVDTITANAVLYF